MTYTEILEAARTLSRTERAQLRTELMKIDFAERSGNGAALVEYLRNNPIDPVFLDEMEKAIEEECEQINDQAA